MKNEKDDLNMEKLMKDLDTVDFDDLEDDFQGVTVDGSQWERYQTIINALISAQDKSGGKILNVDYLDAPDPQSKSAAVMVVMPCAFWIDGEVKDAVILAASLCDRIAVTTSGGRVHVSFTISSIWAD